MTRSLPYIEDKDTFSAVRFALSLKEEMSIPSAIKKASIYYDVNEAEVSYYIDLMNVNINNGIKKENNKIKSALKKMSKIV